jgi:hypothetical protein
MTINFIIIIIVLLFSLLNIAGWKMPVATLSKTWVCDCWFAGIAGSNPAGDMDACRFWVLFVVR